MIRGPYLYADVRLVLNGVNPVSERIVSDPKCRLSKNSLRCYRDVWRQLQRRHPDTRINEFTKEDLDAFMATDNHGRPRTTSASQINRYCNAVRFAFKWAAKAGLLDGPNPTLELRDDWGRRGPTHKLDAVWLEEPEVHVLVDLGACGEDPFELRDRVLLQTMVGTGIRRFEGAALEWGHLLGRGDTLRIMIPLGKGSKPRLVHPTGRTRQALETWRMAVEALQGAPVRPDQPVFPAIHAQWVGGPFGPRRAGKLMDAGDLHRQFDFDRAVGSTGIAGVVAKAGARIGQPTLRPHDLRRTHAGLLQDAGLRLEEIQEQLGHSSVATTERYLKGRSKQINDRLAGATF